MASVDNSLVKPIKNKGKPASVSTNPSSKGKPTSKISSAANKPSPPLSSHPLITSKAPKPSSTSPPSMANLLKLSSIKTELGEKIDAAKKINTSIKNPNHAKNGNNGAISRVPPSQRVGPGPKSRMRPTNAPANKQIDQNPSNPNPTSASTLKSENCDKSKKTSEHGNIEGVAGLDFEQELDNMLKSAEMIFNKPIGNDYLNQKRIASSNEEKLLDESINSEDMDNSFEEENSETHRQSEVNKKINAKEKTVNVSSAATNQKPDDDDDIIFIEFENTPAQKEQDSKIENQVMMNNNRLIELQVELLKKNEEIDSNADQIDILTVKNQDLNEELEKNKQKMEELNEDVQDLQKKFDRAKTAKEDLFKNNKKAESTISDLKNTLSSKDEELKKKKRELLEKSSLNSEFYKRLLDLTKLNTEFNTKTKRTEENFKRKEEELKNKEASEKMLQKEIKKLIPQITELEKTIFDKGQEIEDLDEKLKSLENILKTKNVLLDTKEESDKLMQTEIEELKKDQVEKDKVNSELYKQLLHLTKQNTDSSSRIKLLEDDLQKSDSLKKELEVLKIQNAELKSTADEKMSMHNLAQSKLIVAETSLKEKESLLEEKISEVNSLQEDNSNLKLTSDEKIVLHDSAVSKLNEMDILVKEKVSVLHKKESEVSILQGENLELKVKVSHLNENKNEQIRVNEEKFKQFEVIIEEKEKSLSQKASVEEDLQGKVTELKKEIGELKINAEGKNKLNLKLSTKARKLEDILGDKEEIIKIKVAAESIFCADIETMKIRLEEIKNGTDSRETIIEEFTSKIQILINGLKQDYSSNSLEQQCLKRKSIQQLGNPHKRMNYEDCDTVINDIESSFPSVIVNMVLQELIDNILDNVVVKTK